MSFALTTDQVRARTKTVTRRLGWKTLKPGAAVRAVVKAQGLKKGETVTPIAELRITAVRREPLSSIYRDGESGRLEVVREGFPDMKPDEFVTFFMESHGMRCEDDYVTRIEFEYVDSA